MKSKALFVAALLLSTAAFSQDLSAKSEQAAKVKATTQTAGKSSASADATATSSTNAKVKTHAFNKAEEKANSTKQETKEKSTAQKKAVSAEMKEDESQAKETTQESKEASVGVHSNTSERSENRNNKVSSKASLNSQASVSSDGVKSATGELKNEGKAVVDTRISPTRKEGNQMKEQTSSNLSKTGGKVKANVKTVNNGIQSNTSTSARESVKAGTGINPAVKPKPVVTKINTQVRTNAGLKIR